MKLGHGDETSSSSHCTGGEEGGGELGMNSSLGIGVALPSGPRMDFAPFRLFAGRKSGNASSLHSEIEPFLLVDPDVSSRSALQAGVDRLRSRVKRGSKNLLKRRGVIVGGLRGLLLCEHMLTGDDDIVISLLFLNKSYSRNNWTCRTTKKKVVVARRWDDATRRVE